MTRCNLPESPVPVVFMAVVFLLFSQVALAQDSAQQAAITLSSSLEYQENPLFLSDPALAESKGGDYITTSTASIVLDRQTKYVGTSLNYGANRREFRYDTGDDQGQINGSGSLLVKAIPDLFTWQFGNFRSTQLIDASLPNIPDNQQDIDNWFTGPLITFPIDKATFVRFNSEVGIVSFEETGLLDQDRVSHGLSVSRIISKRITGSVSLNYTNSGFDNLQGNDYSFLNAVVSLQLQDEDYTLSAEIGQYSTKRTNQSSTHPSFNLSGLFRINSRIELSAEFARSVDDLLSNIRNPGNVDQFFGGSDPALDATFGNSNIPNLFVRESYGVGATFTASSAFQIDVRYSKTDRSSVILLREENDENISASLRLPMPVQPRLSMLLTARQSMRSFGDRGPQDRLEFQFRAGYRMTENLNWNFFFSESEQTADFAQDEFSGSSIGFGFTYNRLAI